MTSRKCEEIALAMMAGADGEEPLVPAVEVTAHLAGCVECREEFAQLSDLATLLNAQERREFSADLWPAINERLSAPATPAATPKWPVFLALGLVLVIFKLVEMVPERDLGVLFKLVPLVFVVAVFAYVKENPFKINLELTLEGDR